MESEPLDHEPAAGPPAVARFLLAVAVFGLAGCLLFAVLWWRASRAGTGLDALAPHERQALLEEALEVSPGIYVPAWFAPQLGYTLVPDREIEAWGTTVAANDLGYRSPPSAKPAGTTRVLFLGDSWTFGMGVEREEAFPARLEALARAEAGRGEGDERVESWSLALPGYNLLNQLTGLAFFGDRLAPDVVVVCPTPNDADSTAAVLPNGSLGRTGITPADYGEPLHLVFRSAFADSYTLRERWRESFRRLRRAEQRLADRDVPLLVFFTGTWEPAIAHQLVAEAGLESPYVITPPRLSVGRWRNPPPVRHPSPEAHELYARMIHRALAPAMGWGEGAEMPAGAPPQAEAPVHRPGGAVPAGEGAAAAVRRRRSSELPERFEPGSGAALQAVGPIDPQTGLVAGATMLQLRRPAGADRLRVTLGRVESPSLYPLEVRLEVPSASGGSAGAVTLPPPGREPDGPFVGEVALPDDIEVGSVVDLFLRADRAAAFPGSLAGRSFVVLGVEALGEEAQ